jgi:hypothetical protein
MFLINKQTCFLLFLRKNSKYIKNNCILLEMPQPFPVIFQILRFYLLLFSPEHLNKLDLFYD